MKAPYYQPIIAYPKAWSKGTGGLVKGPLMLLNKLDSATIITLGKKLSGKIVLLENDAATIPAAFNTEAGRLAVKDLNQLPNAYMQPSNISPDALAAEARQVALYQLLESQGALGVLSMDVKAATARYSLGVPMGIR